MENEQDFRAAAHVHGTGSTGPGITGTGSTRTSNAAGFDAGSVATSFQVTYLDPDCGRIRTEIFDDAAEADRFASRCIADEDGWAVVDAVRPTSSRKAA